MGPEETRTETFQELLLKPGTSLGMLYALPLEEAEESKDLTKSPGTSDVSLTTWELRMEVILPLDCILLWSLKSGAPNTCNIALRRRDSLVGIVIS